jgi:hypothetical protein
VPTSPGLPPFTNRVDRILERRIPRRLHVIEAGRHPVTSRGRSISPRGLPPDNLDLSPSGSSIDRLSITYLEDQYLKFLLANS